jgi:hypothetical protein
MKIIIFHDAGEEKVADRLLKVLTDPSCKKTEAFAFPPRWDTKTFVLDPLLSGATHLLTFGEPLQPWFPFVAGIACGKGCPLVLYGASLAHKPGYMPNIVVCKDEAALTQYLNEEAAVLAERETTDKARNTLLGMGIPVTLDSFVQYVREGDIDTARLFLDTGFSVDEKDKNGVPLLCVAARADMRDMVRFLIAKKSDVNQKSGDRGNTALVDAALGKHTDIVKDLIDGGADINAKSKDGQSALIISVGLADVETTRLLLNAGANADEPDLLGATARKYATLFHRSEMLALFERYTPSETATH